MLWTVTAKWTMSDGTPEYEEIDVNAPTSAEAKEEAKRQLHDGYLAGWEIVRVEVCSAAIYSRPYQ